MPLGSLEHTTLHLQILNAMQLATVSQAHLHLDSLYKCLDNAPLIR